MNLQQIRIPIPTDLSRDNLLEYFGNLMEVQEPIHDYAGDEDTGILLRALDLDVGDREQIDGLEVEEVEVTEDDVHVSFVLEISAYLGCSDLNYQNREHRTVTGITDGGDWVFDVFQSPPERTTVEEF
ncbi:hypothetical protein LJR074_002173 [Acidovorax sp. LjRoot74]|uniref:hypothetical protein n=1 Tax=Acidovorax sp. LjRoot74 TaxID=3342337 RepID=UPI003ECC6B25